MACYRSSPGRSSRTRCTARPFFGEFVYGTRHTDFMRIFVSICTVILDCFLCSALYARVFGYFFPNDATTASALTIAGLACSAIVLCAVFPSRVWRNNSDMGAFLNALLAPFAGALLTASGMAVLSLASAFSIGLTTPVALMNAAGVLAVIGACSVSGIIIVTSKLG